MLNTWRLQLLVQFEILGTMHQVAEVMSVSTATVSQQLNLLERETNTILFEKVGRKVQLTTTGHELARKVTPILNQLESIENSLNDSSDEVQGVVRIASFSSALRAVVIPAMSKLVSRYPKIQIYLSEMEPDGSIPALDSHQIDLSVVAYLGKMNALKGPDRKLIELGTDHLMVLVGNNHPLAAKTNVSLSDLMSESWALESDNAYLSKAIKNLCDTAGFQPKELGIFQSYSVMQTAIQHNLGISILPQLAIHGPHDNLHLLELRPRLIRHIYLVTRKAQSKIRSIQLAAEAIEEQTKHVLDK